MSLYFKKLRIKIPNLRPYFRAQTVAGLIWLAKQGYNKEDLLYYATNCKGYDVSQAATDWSILNDHNAQQVLAKRKTRSAVYSIPRCIRAFLESENFEEAIRFAVGLGGDTDTQGSITGGIAEAFYGAVPSQIETEALCRCSMELKSKIQLLALGSH